MALDIIPYRARSTPRSRSRGPFLVTPDALCGLQWDGRQWAAEAPQRVATAHTARTPVSRSSPLSLLSRRHAQVPTGRSTGGKAKGKDACGPVGATGGKKKTKTGEDTARDEGTEVLGPAPCGSLLIAMAAALAVPSGGHGARCCGGKELFARCAALVLSSAPPCPFLSVRSRGTVLYMRELSRRSFRRAFLSFLFLGATEARTVASERSAETDCPREIAVSGTHLCSRGWRGACA
jgi:hypothetical protein